MANVRVVAAIRNARLDAIKTAIDAGAGPGTITIYSTTQPANADAAPGGTAANILGVLTFTDPSAPAASAGRLTFSPITQDTQADNSGTAVWARIRDSNAATVFDCDISVAGGGGTIQLNTTTIVALGPIQISSFTLDDLAA